MPEQRKAELLKSLFNDKLMKETSFDNYIYPKSDFAGSVVNDIRKQFKRDRVKVRKALRKAQKTLHRTFQITI